MPVKWFFAYLFIHFSCIFFFRRSLSLSGTSSRYFFFFLHLPNFCPLTLRASMSLSLPDSLLLQWCISASELYLLLYAVFYIFCIFFYASFFDQFHLRISVFCIVSFLPSSLISVLLMYFFSYCIFFILSFLILNAIYFCTLCIFPLEIFYGIGFWIMQFYNQMSIIEWAHQFWIMNLVFCHFFCHIAYFPLCYILWAQAFLFFLILFFRFFLPCTYIYSLPLPTFLSYLYTFIFNPVNSLLLLDFLIILNFPLLFVLISSFCLNCVLFIFELIFASYFCFLSIFLCNIFVHSCFCIWGTLLHLVFDYQGCPDI